MAYDLEYLGGPLPLASKGVGAVWMLDTIDAVATAIASGYISDGYKRGMKVGDFVIVRKYSALPAKTTLNSVSMHYVTVCASSENTTLSAAIGDTSGLTTLVASGTGSPAVTDDSGDGYSVGSIYVETDADVVYVCTDSTVGAAVWKACSNVLSGTATPDANYDQADGAVLGTIYIETDADDAWVCVDNTAAAAVWVPINNRFTICQQSVNIDNDSTLGAVSLPVPEKSKLVRAYTVVAGATTNQAGTVTLSRNTTAITSGVITIASGAVVQEVDVCTPSALNIFDAGDTLRGAVATTNTGNATVNFVALFERIM